MKDPVMLSGGDLGGEVVEGSGWKIGAKKSFAHPVRSKQLSYRRDKSDGDAGTIDLATFTGEA